MAGSYRRPVLLQDHGADASSAAAATERRPLKGQLDEWIDVGLRTDGNLCRAYRSLPIPDAPESLFTSALYTVSQKTRHQTLGHNFTNYYPIFEIFLLADSAVNLQQTSD